MRTKDSFDKYAENLRNVITGKYGLKDLPVMADLNFGHTSPVIILPYGAEAHMNIDKMIFSIK